MADRSVWPDQRDDRNVVQLGVVEAVEQVDRARSAGGRAHPDLTRELGVADRFEGGHLLVPGLHELRIVVRPRPCRQQPVDPVTRVTEDLLHVPLAQAGE